MSRNIVATGLVILLLVAITGCADGLASAPTALPTLEPTLVSTVIPTVEPTNSPTPTSVPPTAVPTPTTCPALIAIDPGHGGIDFGARCFSRDGDYLLCEAEVSLGISLALRDILEAEGYQVVMVRDGDYGLNDEWVDVNGDGIVDLADEMQARVDFINEQNVDLIISIHQNGYAWDDGTPAYDVGGTTSYYCADREFGEQSKLFSDEIHARVLALFADIGYDVVDRGSLDDATLDPYGGRHLILFGPQSDRIVRASNAPGALDEVLFITNPEEAMMLADPEFQQKLATAYAGAVDAYFEVYPVE